MARLLSNGRRPLLIPGSAQRAIRRPDPRGLITPLPSAEPLTGTEVDYDELEVVRAWRTYEPNSPSQVRYFCYELAQTDPGQPAERYFKAVRLIRLTRVPRYLRNNGSGGGEVFGAMRDVLVGLREKRVLFLNMIAKSPTLPLVFAYGVQATGDTVEEAMAASDDAYAALSVALDGTYQQLEYQPLSLTEGETLARYQAEWTQIAMARGRPMPQGIALGSSGILDGNRTDAENTNNQLEAFIRGMGDRSFMLNMITSPLAPDEMTAAWRNISKQLSKVRSDQQGSRGVNAGIALPLGTGVAMADGTGTTHGLTGTSGVGASDGLNAAQTLGSSYTHTDGTSASVTDTQGVSASQSVSDTHAVATAQGQSVSASESATSTGGASRSDSVNVGQSYNEGVNQGVSSSAQQGASSSAAQGVSASAQQGVSASVGQSYSESLSASTTQGVSVGQSASASQGVSVGQSESLSHGASVSESRGVNASQSLSEGRTASNNWSQSAGQSVNAGQTVTSGFNQSLSESLQQAWNLSYGGSEGQGGSKGGGNSAGLSGGLFGFGSNLGESHNWGINANEGRNNGGGVSHTGGASNTVGTSNSLGQTLGQSLNLGESLGGSLANSQSATNSVGSSHGVTAGQSLSSTIGQSATQSASVGQSVSQALSQSQTAGFGQSAGQSASQGISQSVGQGVSQSVGQGLSQSVGQGASYGTSAGQGMNTGAGQTLGQSQALATGNSLSQGQSLSQSVSDGRTVGQSTGQSISQAVGQGVSASDARGVSAANTQGASTALSQQQALSDAWMVAASRQASTTGSLGVVPNVGASITKQTFNEAKRVVGDILEAQMKRYLDGIEGGGMLYQMSLVCPDRETLVGASSLLKAAFWGAGGDNKRLPSPFHTHVVDDAEEAQRLLSHAGAFSLYRRRETKMEVIEPFIYSTYVTTGEASVFCHPPTHEALGLMANTDSMPVFAMPSNRADRDMYIGRVVDGERGRVSNTRFGVDLSELTHILIQGTTGSGKTTTMMRLLEQATRLTKKVVTPPTMANPMPQVKDVSAGVLALDWMQNFRDLANVVPADRFQLFSVANPELGAFRFNPLEVPHEGMDPAQWLGAQADQLSASFGLGEFGRSLLAEALDELYRANRLAPFELRPARLSADGSGVIEAPAIVLPAVNPAELPAGSIRENEYGEQVANVYTCPRLSRLVGLPEVATIIARKIGEGATQEAGRLQGTDIRNRLQSVWRRLQYYAPGGPGFGMVAADPSLSERECMGVTDLIDPERGLVTVIETDGLDLENRRVVLGSVILAVYRYGLHVGKGCYDHNGKGPGTFVVLEEAHELFGEATEGEDKTSATMRASLYESLFRRARATGLRLVAMTQNCGHVPSAITSMTTTVFVHRTYDEKDRKRVFDLLSLLKEIGQSQREYRYLGEVPKGYCIVRLDAQESYLESAPIQILVDPPALPSVTDQQLAVLAQRRASRVRG